MDFLSNIDLHKNQLLNALLHPSAVAPSSPAEGEPWMDISTHFLKIYTGAAGWGVCNISVLNDDTLGGATPSSTSPPTQLSVKRYVDYISQGLKPLTAVKAASTANIAALSGLLTIDGVVLAAADRVLVKDQTDAKTNGIYTVAAGAWSRASDMDSSAEFSGGYCVVDPGGTANAGTGWVCTVNSNFTMGTDNATFVKFNTVANVQQIENFSILSGFNDKDILFANATATGVELSGASLTGLTITNGVLTPVYEATATNIKMNGTQAVGTRDTAARGDHVHPSDTSRVPTARTVNGKALSVDITLGLASADFANQGAVAQVLHGNATGNPSFGPVVTADITNKNVTYAKMQDVTATDKILGRASAGAGVVEEIPCTAQGRSVIAGTTPGELKTLLGFMTQYAVTIGDGSAKSFTIDFTALNAGLHEVLVQVQEALTGNVVYPDVSISTALKTVTIGFAVAPLLGQYKVVMIG